MVANNPNNEKSSIKWSNPLKKVLRDVKEFMKIEKEENKKPASFSKSINGKDTELKQGSKNSTVLKIATHETKKAKRSEKIKKDTDKEQKLPKKYRKGW